jgi:NAD-dependent dihydropyrimidine dehydrogenase PreA subunit
MVVAYVVTAGCVDVRDRACMDVCPMDCIYEGDRKLYIQPDECIDCGACSPACPQEAIYFDEDVPEDQRWFVADSVSFFAEPLPGRAQPLGMPGGAVEVGRLGVDTAAVARIGQVA